MSASSPPNWTADSNWSHDQCHCPAVCGVRVPDRLRVALCSVLHQRPSQIEIPCRGPLVAVERGHVQRCAGGLFVGPAAKSVLLSILFATIPATAQTFTSAVKARGWSAGTAVARRHPSETAGPARLPWLSHGLPAAPPGLPRAWSVFRRSNLGKANPCGRQRSVAGLFAFSSSGGTPWSRRHR